MNAGGFAAFTIVQDVHTGELLVSAASRPSTLDVTTPVLPLSLVKLLIAAAWWDHRQPESMFGRKRGKRDSPNPAYRTRVSVHDMLVGGSDSAGRQLAIALRKATGTAAVLKDFERYGFGSRRSLALTAETDDRHWSDVLSIGEQDASITGLQVSRFLQAAGNGGMMISPEAAPKQRQRRMMQPDTALRLQAAMRDTVQRGTAQSIADSVAGTGWTIGGKTGTGPNVVGPESDGWFAGLIFNPNKNPRFTIATFVRHGGPGGGNAARISAEVARQMIACDR